MDKIIISIIVAIYATIISTMMIITINLDTEKIKQLEQNNIEQIEEKEVYINRCKMYEDILIEAGLIDECECN